jgi:hypothetical protein
MPSPATPVHLSAGAALELSRRLGFPGARLGEPWPGATSTVHTLGDALCVKVPHLGEEALAACLTHARVAPVARRLGVSAPELVAIVDLPGVPVPLLVSRFLHGEPVRGAAPAVWRAVGADVARLHTADRDPAPPGLRSFTQSRELDPVRLAKQSRGLSATTIRAIVELRDRLVEHVLPDDRPVLCHGDLHADNVIAHHGSYVGLIDFAGAGWLDAAWDFAGIPLDAVAPCMEGYAVEGGRTTGLLPRVVWCRLQLAAHRLATSPDPEAEAVAAFRDAQWLFTRR